MSTPPLLLTSAEMREADRRTISELGLPGCVLMENAGAGLAQVLRERRPDLHRLRVLIVAGPGNNGGDGFVLGRRLAQDGVAVRVILLGSLHALQGDAALHAQVCLRLALPLEEWREEDPALLSRALATSDLVVDALFGTGLTRPLTGLAARAVEELNRCPQPVLAVDIPSGVSADTGEALGGLAIRADWTVTFAALKRGHLLYPGRELAGEVTCIDIGIPRAFLDRPEHRVARNDPAGFPFPRRERRAHKGDAGHLLIVAGSVGKSGAAVLAARGAGRAGAGLVTVAAPAAVQEQIAAQLLEAMTLPLGDAPLETLAACRWSALAVGPGLGLAAGALVRGLLTRFEGPTVVDADGLNVLDEAFLTGLTRTAPLVLTPHPGEMARLTGLTTAEIQGRRLEVARRSARSWGVWLVLKGADTVIAAPDGRAWINDSGNPGLAAGGSGDVLTGILGAFLAQGWPVEQAARAAVWVHGRAADEAGPERGMLASDLLPCVRRLVNGA